MLLEVPGTHPVCYSALWLTIFEWTCCEGNAGYGGRSQTSISWFPIPSFTCRSSGAQVEGGSVHTPKVLRMWPWIRMISWRELWQRSQTIVRISWQALRVSKLFMPCFWTGLFSRRDNHINWVEDIWSKNLPEGDIAFFLAQPFVVTKAPAFLLRRVRVLQTCCRELSFWIGCWGWPYLHYRFLKTKCTRKSSVLAQQFVMMLAVVHFCHVLMGKGDEDTQATKHGRKECGKRRWQARSNNNSNNSNSMFLGSHKSTATTTPSYLFSAFETTVEGLFWRPSDGQAQRKEERCWPLSVLIDEVRVGEAEVNRWNLP